MRLSLTVYTMVTMVCIESTFRLGCEGSVYYKRKQGAVDATCRCLGAGKQQQNTVVKSLLLLTNLFQITPEIVRAASKQRLKKGKVYVGI